MDVEEAGKRMTYDWEAICQEHGSMVWATVFRVLNDHGAAWDCYQEVFLEAWERASKGAVSDWGAFLRWLSVCRALDQVRQRRLSQARGAVAGPAVDALSVDDSPASPVELDELMDQLVAALATLPPRQSEAFWLRAIEDRPYGEIAQLLGTTTNEVGVLIHRARESLRTALSAFDPAVREE